MTPVSAVVRVARPDDLDGLFKLASAGGVGLTNLPADRAALARRLEASAAAVADAAERETGAAVVLVTEVDGEIAGTGCVFARVGADWPFFSFRLTRQTKRSAALDKRVTHSALNLVNDFDGDTEIGGLLVDPARRGGRLGVLTARARYLFIAQHRDWFRGRVIAELRGYQNASGVSPVWEALGRHFYDMPFEVADRLNAMSGSQFIADLCPRHAIYVSLLPQAAQDALGRPHDDGRRAYDMLLDEGFRRDGYVDIFDGGPTLVADIDDLRTVRAARDTVVAGVNDNAGSGGVLACTGLGDGFRAAIGSIDDAGRVDRRLAAALDIGVGDPIRITPL